MNLYHLTKFPLYLSFTVHYNYPVHESQQVYANSIHKNCFKLFLYAHFSFWKFFYLNLTLAAMLNLSITPYHAFRIVRETDAFWWLTKMAFLISSEHKHRSTMFLHCCFQGYSPDLGRTTNGASVLQPRLEDWRQPTAPALEKVSCNRNRRPLGHQSSEELVWR